MATEKSSLEAQKPWFGVFRFFELSIFGAALYFLLALASVLVGHTTGGPHWKFYGVFGVALHSLPFAFAALFLLEGWVLRRCENRADERAWWNGWWAAFISTVIVMVHGLFFSVDFSRFSVNALIAVLAIDTAIVGFAVLYVYYVVRQGAREFGFAVGVIAALVVGFFEAWGALLYALVG